MASCTYNCLMNVINIGNSIIGVSILAMPYCFRKCGILLSVVLILLSGCLTRLACYLLLKSAIKARRRNFEFLAFHTFGSTGKLAVEMSVIGFLIGVCIAFFVVIGDLGPPLAAEFLEINNSSNLRTNVLMLVGLCVALPLGMLRKIDSLTSLSALSIAFYICLILKIFAEAVPNLAANNWWNEVNWWRSEGLLPCMPIFSMALSCQTQLFEFFDTMNDPSLKRMQSVISGAVHLCSTVYVMVGTLGYIAFYDKVITGNILLFLTPSAITEIIKFGFIITVAVSFPLCLFPCRSSLHSLLFKQGFGHHELNVTVIPENRFRILTVSLVIVTIGIAIMLPNIEFVLGIIGSTIGTLICLIFPALMFIHDTSKNTTEKRMAQVLMSIGAFILIACTYSTLQDTGNQPPPVVERIQNILKVTPESLEAMSSSTIANIRVPIAIVPLKEEMGIIDKEKQKQIINVNPPDDQKRLEPPIPQEPELKIEPNADLDPQALQKEDKELQKEIPPSSNGVESKKDKNIEKQEKLLQKLEEQHQEQRLILEQQKKVLEELKLHQEIHEVQQKADAEQPKKVNLPQDKEIASSASPKNEIKDIEAEVKDKQSKTLPIVVVDSEQQVNPPKEPKKDLVKNDSFAESRAEDRRVAPEIQPVNNVESKRTQMLVEKTGSVKSVFNSTVANIIPKVIVLGNEKELKVPAKENAVNIPVSTEKERDKPVQNNFDAHINRREPLEDKYSYDATVTSYSDIKFNDLVLRLNKV